MKKRVKMTVFGLVQGVSFRHFTQQNAQLRHVSGWVRNLPTGEVEGCFEGKATDVDSLIDWCRLGPSRAEVERVEVVEEPFIGEFSDFRVRH